MKNFEQFGVQELNAKEMRETDGGVRIPKRVKKWIRRFVLLVAEEAADLVDWETLGKNVSDSINTSGKNNPVGTFM